MKVQQIIESDGGVVIICSVVRGQKRRHVVTKEKGGLPCSTSRVARGCACFLVGWRYARFASYSSHRLQTMSSSLMRSREERAMWSSTLMYEASTCSIPWNSGSPTERDPIASIFQTLSCTALSSRELKSTRSSKIATIAQSYTRCIPYAVSNELAILARPPPRTCGTRSLETKQERRISIM